MRGIIKNGSAHYVVVAGEGTGQYPRRALLRRLEDNEHVIAEGIVWDSETECYWAQECDFGRDVKAATKAFFGDDEVE